MNAIPEMPGSSWQQFGQLRRNFFEYLMQASRHGDLVRMRPAPGVSIHLLNHPDLLHEVLVTQASRFRKSKMTRRLAYKFLGDGLVLTEGETHRRHRALLQPGFRPDRLAAFVPLLGLGSRQFLQGWQEDSVQDLSVQMSALTLRGLVMSLFDLQESDDVFGVSESVRVFAQSIGRRFRSVPLPDWVPVPRHWSERRAIRGLDLAIESILRSRRLLSASGGLVSRLLEANDTAGGLTAKQVRDHLATLYFAGHETSAKLLAWTGWLLARHPQWQERLWQELRNVASDQVLDARVLDQLVQMDQFLLEVLRLYPPVWLFDREAAEPVQLGGYALPEGTSFYLSPYVMHRDARWFPDPLTFEPERFVAGWEKRLPAQAFIGFGGGPRACIGRGYAMLSAKCAIAHLLQNWRLQAVSAEDIAPQAWATLEPSRPLQVRVQRRVA